MSVDILPTQIPQDASAHFSAALMPYLRTLIRQYQGSATSADKERLEALDRATIAQHGALQGVHRWLVGPLREFRQAAATAPAPAGGGHVGVRVTRKKRVLVLGSGMVARPAVEELGKRTDVQLVVGARPVRPRRVYTLTAYSEQ